MNKSLLEEKSTELKHGDVHSFYQDLVMPDYKKDMDDMKEELGRLNQEVMFKD